MSDPAKTPEEIEDVLASIRRLVSDHGPELDGSMHALVADDDTAAAAASDALVLTPSFRVTDPEDPWVPVSASEAEETILADVPDVPDLADTADVEDSTATAALMPSGDDTDWRPDDRLAAFDSVGAEATMPSSEDWPNAEEGDLSSPEDIADLIRMDGSTAQSADFESETGDDNWPEGGAEAALLTLVARREPPAEEAEAAEAALEDTFTLPMARAEAERVAAEEEAYPVHDEPSPGDTAIDAPTHEPTGTDALEEALSYPTESDAHDHEAVTAERGIFDDAVAPQDAALQDTALDDAAPQDAAPEDAEAGYDMQATPIFSRRKLAEAAETDEADGSDAPAEDVDEVPSSFTFPETEDGILDEDTLREIITEVVREELQGVLGQRITRNVRKMVRREIRLAMAAEDLE